MQYRSTDLAVSVERQRWSKGHPVERPASQGHLAVLGKPLNWPDAVESAKPSRDGARYFEYVQLQPLVDRVPVPVCIYVLVMLDSRKLHT